MQDQGSIEPRRTQRSWTTMATHSCAGWDANRRHRCDLPTNLQLQDGHQTKTEKQMLTVRTKQVIALSAISHKPIILHAHGNPHLTSDPTLAVAQAAQSLKHQSANGTSGQFQLESYTCRRKHLRQMAQGKTTWAPKHNRFLTSV